MTTPQNPISLYDWFDPYDHDHIRAYRQLENTGSWPEGFIPEEVEIPTSGLWHIQIVAKMAQAWMTAMEEGKV